MTNIKDRILQIAELKGVKKELFFKNLGLSYANFKGIQKKSALNSDAIDKILSKYNDISYEWLISGIEPMLKEDYHKMIEQDPWHIKMFGTPKGPPRIENKESIEHYSYIISLLEQNKELLEKRVATLEQQLANCTCQKVAKKVLKVAESQENYTTKNTK